MVAVKFTACQRDHLVPTMVCVIHAGHCLLDGQHYEFFGDVLPTTALIGPSKHDDPLYVFHVAYWDAKASRH
jgi:hypothetical protein